MSTRSLAVEFLMIDDNHGIAEFLSWYLHERRHTCAALDNGSAVTAWLEQNRCEVAIVDLHMQPVDGITVIRRIREIDAHLPIVVFTGLGYDEEHMQAALRAGANGYVSKVLPAEQLYCVLARVLATARREARSRHPRQRLLGAA
ncbi:MAG: response regulator [Verrucomicrobia bacterium]|nr:response regulator [Verrucomicrobiota bacterium]